MTTNAPSRPNGGGCGFKHDPPVNVADLRVVRYIPVHGPGMYEFLGGNAANYPGCVLSVEDNGKALGYGLGSHLMSRGKEIKYAMLRTREKQPLKTMDESDQSLGPEYLAGNKIIVVSDVFLCPEERQLVQRRLDDLRKRVEFGDVAYAIERESQE